MALFLSKLLPLFFYPLGLSSLLIAIALVILLWRSKRSRNVSNASKVITLFKKNRLTTILLGIALAILLLSSNEIFSNWLVRSLEWKYLPNGELPQA